MSRKFLTPIVLPGNPSATLEAAPKQYVDAQVATVNEVVISATDPIGTNPSAEIWIDTSV